MLRAQQLDIAGVLRLRDVDDLDGVIPAGTHAPSPVDGTFRTDPDSLKDAVVWNVYGHKEKAHHATPDAPLAAA